MRNQTKKKVLFFLTLLLFVSCTSIRNIPGEKPVSDAKKIANIDWTVKKIQKGIRLKTASLQLFDSPQEIFLVEIDTARAEVNYHVGMPKGLAGTSAQAKLQDALVAINGSYFNMKEGYSIHFVKIDNKVLAATAENEFKTRATGIFSVTGNRVDIERWDKEQESQNARKAEDALVSGPIIVDNGTEMEMWKSTFVTARHPRSFAAFSKGRLLLVVVDGRAPGRAAGMNLIEIRTFANALGCTDVLNLDGGGSTTLYVKGQKSNGIVNVPSDGKERPVSSIIYITPAKTKH